MKVASTTLQKRIFQQMSDRASAMIKEDLEELGSIKIKEAQKAQFSILLTCLRLDYDGDLQLLNSDDSDDYI